MIERARQLGIGVKTLKRARQKRGIVASKAGKDAGWMWRPRSRCLGYCPLCIGSRGAPPARPLSVYVEQAADFAIALQNIGTYIADIEQLMIP